MTVIVTASALADAVTGITPSATTATLPAVGMARLVIDSTDCFVQAKGKEVQATARFSANLGLDPNLDLFVPARRLGSMLGALGDVDVELWVDGDVLGIQSDRTTLTVQGITAPDEPRVPIFTHDSDDGAWWPSLGDLVYAASEDQNKPSLRSVQLADGWAFCTDSYRIAAHRTTYDGRDLVIPAELVREASAVCGTVTEVGDDVNALYVAGEKGWLRSTLIEAAPLAWTGLTPPDMAKMRGSFSAEAMTDALRVCRAAIEDTTHGNARISVKALDGVIELSVGTKDGPLSAVAAIDGNDLTFATSIFNPLFLNAAIAQVSHDEDTIYFHQIDRQRFSFAMFTTTEVAADADELAVVVPYSNI